MRFTSAATNRWEIELLLKQLKQNFPLRYFYGESANAIKIQIWVTLIANLLLMVVLKRVMRSWSFSGLATMVRIMLMYYVNIYSFLEDPEKDWARIRSEAEISLTCTFWTNKKKPTHRRWLV